MAVFNVHFQWSFLEKSCTREREKQIAPSSHQFHTESSAHLAAILKLRILHRKWLKNNNNITTLTVFSVLFRWSFLENNAQEKKKKKLHHCHIIFMVYNLTDQSAWSLLFYCTIIWDLQYMRSTIVLQGGIFRLFNFLQPPSHTISLNKERIVSLLCIKFCLFIHCHHFIRQTKHFQRQHSLWGLPWI